MLRRLDQIRRVISRPEMNSNPMQLFKLASGEISRRLGTQSSNTTRRVTLPWGLPLAVRSTDAIGLNVLRFGLYDLTLSETLHRLLDPGETAFDVGANIGHMSSVMAARVGTAGRVFAFEPHPEIFAELNHNQKLWQNAGLSNVEVHRYALSDRSGQAKLNLPVEFSANRGTAFIGEIESTAGETKHYSVEMKSLDEAFCGHRIDVMKIDVEGHELQVLQGASKLLEEGAIRDIVFEEHSPLPTPTTTLLQEKGYSLFFLASNDQGPYLVDTRKRFDVPKNEAPNYLATRNPSRATERFEHKGWDVLRRRVL
jgi:FkbM family methyltransferase